MGDLGERIRGEALKRGWLYGKIKDCQGREREKGEGWRKGGRRVCEEEQREKWMEGGCTKNIMHT